MIKKIFFIIFVLFFVPMAYSAQVVNIEYIHTMIADRWDITIPYNREITNVGVVANMKYLLTAIDVANEILNGEKITDYGNGEFATMVAADTVATDTAIETLVQKKPGRTYSFSATIDLSLYDDNLLGHEPVTEFGFYLGARGTFYVDWGDGTAEIIEKDNTDLVTYVHDYGVASGIYIVQIGGLAIDYSDDEFTPAISFGYDNLVGIYSAPSMAITAISGSLGAMFPTLSDGSQPRFISTFSQSMYLNEIPSELFDGVHGAPVSNMFYDTFSYMHNIASIPGNLFNGITGAAEGMFTMTFSDWYRLTNIPENLFGGITDIADGMFVETFWNAYNLTGPSARINGKYLYEIWPDATAEQVGLMYGYSDGLDDWDNIPCVWKDYDYDCD